MKSLFLSLFLPLTYNQSIYEQNTFKYGLYIAATLIVYFLLIDTLGYAEVVTYPFSML